MLFKYQNLFKPFLFSKLFKCLIYDVGDRQPVLFTLFVWSMHTMWSRGTFAMLFQFIARFAPSRIEDSRGNRFSLNDILELSATLFCRHKKNCFILFCYTYFTEKVLTKLAGNRRHSYIKHLNSLENRKGLNKFWYLNNIVLASLPSLMN